MNCGSGESLNASVRCGLSPKARQMRLTAVWLIPVAAAIERVDQCVALAGCSSSVFTITRSMSSSRIERRLARPRLVMQPVQTTLGEPSPPPADRRGIAAQLRRDLPARPTLRRRQDNPAAERERLRTLRPPSPPLEHLPLLIAEHHLCTLRHDRLQSSPMRTTSEPIGQFLLTNDSGH